jgi:hypothetical protein
VVLIFLEHTVTQPDVVNGPGDTLVCHLGIDNLLTLGVALYGTNDKHGWTSFGEEDLQSGRELLDEMVRQFMAALAARERARQTMLPVQADNDTTMSSVIG